MFISAAIGCEQHNKDAFAKHYITNHKSQFIAENAEWFKNDEGSLGVHEIKSLGP